MFIFADSTGVSEMMKAKKVESRKIWTQLKVLIEEGKVRKIGHNRWLKYEFIV